MPTIAAFGKYLPERTVGNQELAATLQCEANWIEQVSGIAWRRVAGDQETVPAMGARAAADCLARSGIAPRDIRMLLVSSGSGERRFPGPAGEVAAALKLDGVPAIDLPMASAGSLFGLALAAKLAPSTGPVLVVASEKISVLAHTEPLDKNIAILFGDGAGACLVMPSGVGLRVTGSVLHSDGNLAEHLSMDSAGHIHMNGMNVIRHASTKIPAAIREVLGETAGNEVAAYLMHQANQNLIDRVAGALGVESARFFTNIRSYGNTSSASMLIAATEWSDSHCLQAGDKVCFAGFGAGYHWGAVLCEAA